MEPAKAIDLIGAQPFGDDIIDTSTTGGKLQVLVERAKATLKPLSDVERAVWEGKVMRGFEREAKRKQPENSEKVGFAAEQDNPVAMGFDAESSTLGWRRKLVKGQRSRGTCGIGKLARAWRGAGWRQMAVWRIDWTQRWLARGYYLRLVSFTLSFFFNTHSISISPIRLLQVD
ncbi:BQ5605_C008g05339 [Microbotryum silenes-dioicae]|uniref:BQ5605_C008g05339 protein n=1 Tax=Microbotryum silenes-dioicae TaxID=796604 RepID=A0A2X0PEF1_9BASI|nr:BQ5605_C008g05339 [Microbotryum silenes-dioicae]